MLATMQSSDKLLLSLPRTALALSAKAFSISAPSVWNSLSYNCRSVELLSTFNDNLKTELFGIAYSERQHSAWSLPLCATDSFTTYIMFQKAFPHMSQSKFCTLELIMIRENILSVGTWCTADR